MPTESLTLPRSPRSAETRGIGEGPTHHDALGVETATAVATMPRPRRGPRSRHPGEVLPAAAHGPGPCVPDIDSTLAPSRITPPEETDSFRPRTTHRIRRPEDERGMSSSVQLSLLFPAFLILFFLAMQWSLYYWASTTALAAAQDGARAAAAYGSNLSNGILAAERALTTDALQKPQVSGERGAITTTITVTGHSRSLVPGWKPQITKTASVPTERLTRK